MEQKTETETELLMPPKKKQIISINLIDSSDQSSHNTESRETCVAVPALIEKNKNKNSNDNNDNNNIKNIENKQQNTDNNNHTETENNALNSNNNDGEFTFFDDDWFTNDELFEGLFSICLCFFVRQKKN